MNRSIHLFIILALLCAIWPSSVVRADDTSGQAALAWLMSQQNADGSWGVYLAVKALYTSEAVAALRSFYKLNGAYYGGIAWMENHDFVNLDYQGRKILSLLSHGASVQSLTNAVVQARSSVFGAAGWGLSDAYTYTPLDTALALSALRNTGWSDYASALTFLQSRQNADGGWGIGPAAGSNPLTTAIVTQTLCRYKPIYPQIDAAVISAEGYLAGHVGTGDSALLRAETLLALLPNGRQTTKADSLLNSLENDQNTAGDWESDPYATARVIRAMAMALGKNPDAQAGLSDVCDAALRSALNSALNKNAADALTQGEMQSITSLSASGRGIADLCGLADATQLTSADLRNNRITSLQPLLSLPNLQTVQLDGNPLSATEDADGDGFSDLAELQGGSNPLDSGSVPSATPVPAVDLYGLLLAVAVLTAFGLKKRRNDQMLKTLRIALMTAVVFLPALTAALVLVPPAAARDESVVKELPAEKAERVKGVGRALLQAKRSYQPPDEAIRIRQDLEQLHTLLDTLTIPVDGEKLQLKPMAPQSQTGQTVRDPWREKRSGEISQLLGLADRIEKQGSSLTARRKTRQNTERGTHRGLPPISTPALTRLGQLRGELEQVLVLPAQERQARLMKMKQQVKLDRRTVIREADKPSETPTMMNRTQHRPMRR